MFGEEMEKVRRRAVTLKGLRGLTARQVRDGARETSAARRQDVPLISPQYLCSQVSGRQRLPYKTVQSPGGTKHRRRDGEERKEGDGPAPDSLDAIISAMGIPLPACLVDRKTYSRR